MVRTWMYTYYMVQKKGYDDYLHGNHQKIIKKPNLYLSIYCLTGFIL